MHFSLLIPAQHNNTAVTVKKKKSDITEVHRLNASQHKQINVSPEDYFSVDADKPVSVVQYLVTHVVQGDCVGHGGGGTCSSSSSSSLLFVPPMEQREHQYLFSAGGGGIAGGGKQNVNLVIATPLREGVILNGVDLFSYIHNTSNPAYSNSLPSWIDIDNNSNNNGSSSNSNVSSSYSAIQFLIEEGLHKLTHNSTKAEFSATLNRHHDQSQSAIISSHSTTSSASFVETGDAADKVVGYIQDQILSGNGAIPPNPTAKVEKSNTKDEINNAYLAKSQTVKKEEEEPISHSVIAMIVTLCTAVLLVIICIGGFVFAEFAFHNGEKSLFKSARVAPYEPIEPN